jgi:Protein tyrosine and serine/threonine kinase
VVHSNCPLTLNHLSWKAAVKSVEWRHDTRRCDVLSAAERRHSLYDCGDWHGTKRGLTEKWILPSLKLENVHWTNRPVWLFQGMIFLHDSEIISHGHLQPSNCLVDSRWVLQISDFGLYDLKYTVADLLPPSSASEADIDNYYMSKFIKWHRLFGGRSPYCNKVRGGDRYTTVFMSCTIFQHNLNMFCMRFLITRDHLWSKSFLNRWQLGLHPLSYTEEITLGFRVNWVGSSQSQLQWTNLTNISYANDAASNRQKSLYVLY